MEQYPQTAYLDDILQQYNGFTKQLDTKIGSQQQKKMLKNLNLLLLPDARQLQTELNSVLENYVLRKT